MPNKYLNDKAINILEANQRPGQSLSGVVVEMARKSDSNIPDDLEVPV